VGAVGAPVVVTADYRIRTALAVAFVWLAMSSLLVGCGGSETRWVPNEALLAEMVKLNPETEPKQVGKAVRRYFDEALLDAKRQKELKGKKRKTRYVDAFEVLRSSYLDGGAVVSGFNVCFPESYSPPKDSEVPQLMIYGWECQLIQGNGPSVAVLRKDPLVAKYLDAKGDLVAGSDIDLMHDDLNGAIYRIDPSNSQRPLYPDAQGNLEKILNQWERPSIGE
jgi:hypothetical protein